MPQILSQENHEINIYVVLRYKICGHLLLSNRELIFLPRCTNQNTARDKSSRFQVYVVTLHLTCSICSVVEGLAFNNSFTEGSVGRVITLTHESTSSSLKTSEI